jgi:MEMO1 family protein
MWRNHEQNSSPVRPTAVAGQFYPADPGQLRAEVEFHLAAARVETSAAPKAAIVPHAGYMFSGPVAGSVYACLAAGRERVRRVVLLGPSHHVAFRGLAASSAAAFACPLGSVALDQEALDRARSLPQVITLEEAHRDEHSLEVQLPFLRTIFPEFKLAPLLVGDAQAEEVSEVLDLLWGGPDTCIVVSSDLSHFHDYQAARRLDRAAAQAIESMEAQNLLEEQACGAKPIRGLLKAARKHGLRCQLLDLRNSGDTAGSRDRVVGYGGFVFLAE